MTLFEKILYPSLLIVLVFLVWLDIQSEQAKQQFIKDHHCVLKEIRQGDSGIGIAGKNMIMLVGSTKRVFECDNGLIIEVE